MMTLAALGRTLYVHACRCGTTPLGGVHDDLIVAAHELCCRCGGVGMVLTLVVALLSSRGAPSSLTQRLVHIK
jgi:hypothetical protein